MIENQRGLENITRKNKQFRTQIRRQQLEELFKARRQEILQYKNEMVEQRRSMFLLSIQNKQEFLQQAGLALTGQPNPQWKQIILNLRDTVNVFNGEFQSWFKLSIIKNLMQCLKIEAREAYLGAQVCGLLADMIYVSHIQSQQMFVSRLMEYQFVINAVVEFQNPRNTLSDKMSIVLLLSKICGINNRCRQIIYRDGGYTKVLQLGKLLLLEQDPNVLLVDYFYNVCGFVQQYGSCNQKLTVINMSSITLLFKMTLGLLAKPMNDQARLAAYTLIGHFLRIGKENVVRQFADNQVNIINLIQLLKLKNLKLVKAGLQCVDILCFLSSNYFVNLAHTGLLSTLYTLYRTNGSHQKILKYIINIIHNSTDNTVTFELAKEERLLEVIVQNLENSSLKIRYAVFEIINSILSLEQHNTMNVLIQKYELLRIFMKQICNYKLNDVQTTALILQILMSLIQKSHKQYVRPQQNWILNQLINQYNYPIILQNHISSQIHNALLRQRMNRACEQIHHILYNTSLDYI